MRSLCYACVDPGLAESFRILYRQLLVDPVAVDEELSHFFGCELLADNLLPQECGR